MPCVGANFMYMGWVLLCLIGNSAYCFRLSIVHSGHVVQRFTTSSGLFLTDGFKDLKDECIQMNLSEMKIEQITSSCENVGWDSTSEILSFARDFENNPEAISRILIADFGVKPIIAHNVRAVAIRLLKQERLSDEVQSGGLPLKNGNEGDRKTSIVTKPHNVLSGGLEDTTKAKFKDVIVDIKSQKRMMDGDMAYGLTKSGIVCSSSPIFIELEQFGKFMIEPIANAQDAPIRPSTARVYLRHADLFLGWYAKHCYHDSIEEQQSSTITDTPEASTSATSAPTAPTAAAGMLLSLELVFPSKEREHVKPVFDFIRWLREERTISTSYEANVLRGLTKLAKFRFAHESQADPGYGEKSFEDIPLVKEIRKLHTDANRRQSNAPRVSNEQLKWMTWTDYLQVVQGLQQSLRDSLVEASKEAMRSRSRSKRASTVTTTDSSSSSSSSSRNQSDVREENDLDENFILESASLVAAISQRTRKQIAIQYQKYLLLAFFSCVPDRQRTFRELEIGRTFVKNEDNQWTIRHGPEDYKTGAAYGERPPLLISRELTAAVDDYIEHWRSALQPRSAHLFIQSRTGNALTGDSVYFMVSSCCFQHAGKRTNPHLLRDIIVTHVRGNTQASEKELEALALYMGHSINMQRSSYDRRTLPQKVAPAVSLLESLSTSGNIAPPAV